MIKIGCRKIASILPWSHQSTGQRNETTRWNWKDLSTDQKRQREHIIFRFLCVTIISYFKRKQSNNGEFLSYLTGTPAAKKAIKIVLLLGALNQFCGAFAMLNYANKIFEDAGSTLDPNTASVIVAVVQLTANFISMGLVDRAGRKLLVIVSAVGTAIGLICMGFYDLFKDRLTEYGWIPIISFSMIILMSSIGMLPLTYVLLSEIIPKKVHFGHSFFFLFFSPF